MLLPVLDICEAPGYNHLRFVMKFNLQIAFQSILRWGEPAHQKDDPVSMVLLLRESRFPTLDQLRSAGERASSSISTGNLERKVFARRNRTALRRGRLLCPAGIRSTNEPEPPQQDLVELGHGESHRRRVGGTKLIGNRGGHRITAGRCKGLE